MEMLKSRLSQFRSPLNTFFAVLSLIIVISFSFIFYFTWITVNQHAVNELRATNQLLAQGSNQTFYHYRAMLKLLGERLLDLDAGNHPERGKALVDQLIRLNPELIAFGLARSDGQLVIVSGIQKNALLPNLLTQPQSTKTFKAVLATEKMLLGRTYYMRLLQNWLIPIRMAVKDEKGGVPLVVTAGIGISKSSVFWKNIKLPEGFQAGLLRPDSYWQMLKPVVNDRHETYGQDVAPDIFRYIVSNIKTTDSDSGISSVFSTGERIYAGLYLPEWNLYSIVSIPQSLVYQYFLKDMLLPVILFIGLLITGYVVYRFLKKQQKSYEYQLIQQAHFDHLTKLPNRLLGIDRLDQAINQSERGTAVTGVVFLDLDHFKRVNDSFGHLSGDELLVQCADRLKSILRAGDTIARLGGDEFLIVLPLLESSDHVEHVFIKIQSAFEKAFTVGNREIVCSCSAGIAIYPSDGENSEELLRASDTALYNAKDHGRNTYCFFSEKMNQVTARRMELETELRHALDKKELYLVYQPQVDIATSVWTGCEALLRWHNPLLGDIEPLEFIPIAEETGLIRKIGEFVIHQACQDLQIIQARTSKAFRMAINLSPVQLDQTGLTHLFSDIVHQYKFSPDSIELEITESMMVENGIQLEALRQQGLRIAIDDFGTGFCSLSYLQRFPVNTLKIDKSFIMDINHKSDDASLVKAIINLGKSLQLDIVAEGVEAQDQVDYLLQSGCQSAQGFHFSHPLSIDRFLARLE